MLRTNLHCVIVHPDRTTLHMSYIQLTDVYIVLRHYISVKCCLLPGTANNGKPRKWLVTLSYVFE